MRRDKGFSVIEMPTSGRAAERQRKERRSAQGGNFNAFVKA